MLIHDVLGIEAPIIQAPMAGIQGSAMAIAVSNAGGLGSLPCAMLSPEELRSELTAIKSGTHKPVNLNFFAHTVVVKCFRPPSFELSSRPVLPHSAAIRRCVYEAAVRCNNRSYSP